jgi:hypothetical protein
MKKISLFFKWAYLRKKSRMCYSYDGNRNLNPNEKLLKNIIIKILSNPNSVILVNPILESSTKKIYMQTEDKEYSVIIKGNMVKISNHNLFIETYVDPFFSRLIFKIINRYISKYQSSISDHSVKNELKGLNSILNQLNK